MHIHGEGKTMYANLKCILLLIALIGFSATSDAAESLITECGKSTGYAFYIPGGAVSANNSGFRPDGETGGYTRLEVINGHPSITILNSAGEIAPVEAQGGVLQILPSKLDFGVVHFVVLYSDAITDYIFKLDSAGNGILITTMSRANSIVNKSAVYQSECRR